MPKPHIYNKNIFISYSRQNRQRCDELATHLRNAGYIPWYDKQIDAGDKWWLRICAEIEKCQIFLILLEPNISDSLYCPVECDYATALGRHIIPAEINAMNGAIPEWIAERQVHKLTDGTDLQQHMRLMGAFNKLALLDLREIETCPYPRPACPKTPQQQFDDACRAKIQDLQRLITPDLDRTHQFWIYGELEVLLDKKCSWLYCKELVSQLRNTEHLFDTIGRKLDKLESQYAGSEMDIQLSSQEAAKSPLEVEGKVDLILPDMLKIPADTFLMGSAKGGRDNERPQHQVISAFEISKTPITNEQYVAFLNAQLSESIDEKRLFTSKNDDKSSRIISTSFGYKVEDGYSDYPVVYVSWYGAQAYASWIAESTSQPFALPSEAEWEYACRAGSETKYFWGDDATDAEQYAWFNKNSNDGIHPVGKREPNSFGLYDMAGLVWEWLKDGYHANYKPSDCLTVGSASESASSDFRVLRGGSWIGSNLNLRSSFRNWSVPDNRDNDVGFRIVCHPIDH